MFKKVSELELYLSIKQMEEMKEDPEGAEEAGEDENVTVQTFNRFWDQIKEPDKRGEDYILYSPVYVSVLLPPEGFFIIPTGFCFDKDWDILEDDTNLLKLFCKTDDMEGSLIEFINKSMQPLLLRIGKDMPIAIIRNIPEEERKTYEFMGTQAHLPGIYQGNKEDKIYTSVAIEKDGAYYYLQYNLYHSTLRDPVLKKVK